MRVLAATLPFAILLGSVVRTVVAQGHLKDSRISGHKDYDDISTLFDSIVQLKRALPSQDPDTSVPQDGPESLLGEGQRYNSSVATACRKTIESRESVANTLDIVACYNVPFFDVSSGKFVADIRLYQPSELRDFPAELNPSEYTLEVTIPQAALSEPRHITAENPKDDLSGFSMLYGLQHVGQLNPQIQLDKLSLYVLPSPYVLTRTNKLQRIHPHPPPPQYDNHHPKPGSDHRNHLLLSHRILHLCYSF